MLKSKAHKFTMQRLTLNELSLSQLLATLQNGIKPSKEVYDSYYASPAILYLKWI